MSVYPRRLARLRESMEEHGVSVLFLPVSSTLEYFTGIGWPIPNPTEHDRPGDWVSGMYLGLTDGPVIVEPRMGSDGMVRQVEDKPWIADLRILGEPEDYGGVLAEIVQRMRGNSGGRIAIAEHAWAKTVIAVYRAAPDAEIINAHDLIWPMRMVKDEQELAAMERASALCDAAFPRILSRLQLGMTVADIKRIVDDVLFDLGANWMSFHTGIYIGSPPDPDAESALAARGRTVQRGGTIAFDFGALLDGYCSDFGRTVFI
ncbi:MAG: M24 family metallopeptidase, partial [Chloroflexota bacterium]